jgi:D-glycero-alpha-D-manno-heptose-7-phosphate kinase
LNLPLGEYDMARLAYEIERIDLGLAGGKQDQYAATFGGVNYMEFFGDQVIVNPLRIKNWIRNEIESSLLLYFTGTSRESAAIINEQIRGSRERRPDTLEALHALKRSAAEMKNAILTGNFRGLENCLREGWIAKKKTSAVISNTFLDGVYDFIMENGGRAAKISGAGGGGFMMILCDPRERFSLAETLRERGGGVSAARLTERGAEAWTLYE